MGFDDAEQQSCSESIKLFGEAKVFYGDEVAIKLKTTN